MKTAQICSYQGPTFDKYNSFSKKSHGNFFIIQSISTTSKASTIAKKAEDGDLLLSRHGSNYLVSSNMRSLRRLRKSIGKEIIILYLFFKIQLVKDT